VGIHSHLLHCTKLRIKFVFLHVNALYFLVSFMLHFTAQAYNYHGETLLAQDKCGDAIKCLEESQSRNSLFLC